MFTYELARRLEGSGVTATVLHPGVVNTGFGAGDPSRIFKVIIPFYRPFMKTPQQGAATSVYLASSPNVEGVTGTYFAKGRPEVSNKARTTSALRSAFGMSVPTLLAWRHRRNACRSRTEPLVPSHRRARPSMPASALGPPTCRDGDAMANRVRGEFWQPSKPRVAE
jgi:hypothetical protein